MCCKYVARIGLGMCLVSLALCVTGLPFFLLNRFPGSTISIAID
jgi:hypothetical protein